MSQRAWFLLTIHHKAARDILMGNVDLHIRDRWQWKIPIELIAQPQLFFKDIVFQGEAPCLHMPAPNGINVAHTVVQASAFCHT